MKWVLLAVTTIATQVMPAIANAAAVDQYECHVVQITPPERNDYDPVARTTLTTMAAGSRLTDFTVEHETVRGAVYVRQQQYRDQRVWTARNGDNWSGRSIRNSSLTMVGTLSKGPRGLFYVEQIFREGRLETTISHQCNNDLALGARPAPEPGRNNTSNTSGQESQ